MGRKRKAGNRSPSGRKRKPTTALERETRVAPNDRVLERRRQFAWVRPKVDKNGQPIDGNNGEVDQQVRDALGQFHVLGLLDGERIDGEELLEAGRRWGNHYLRLMRGEKLTAKAQSYERQDIGRLVHGMTNDDHKFDVMDMSLTAHEGRVLFDLIVAPEIGEWPTDEEFTPWATNLIADALLRRGIPPRRMQFPTAHDWGMLEDVKAALVGMVEALQRWKRAA